MKYMFQNKILLTDFRVDIKPEYHYTSLIVLKIRQIQISYISSRNDTSLHAWDQLKQVPQV